MSGTIASSSPIMIRVGFFRNGRAGALVQPTIASNW